jgi:hypothetical protein
LAPLGAPWRLGGRIFYIRLEITGCVSRAQKRAPEGWLSPDLPALFFYHFDHSGIFEENA